MCNHDQNESRNRKRATLAVSRFVALSIVILIGSSVRADVFTVKLDTGEQVKVSARHAGSGQASQALEFSDGALQIIPDASLVSREARADPTPLSHDELLQRLLTEFGEDRTITEIEKPFVIVLIRDNNRAADPTVDRKLRLVVKKAGQFFKGMQNSFLEFMKQARVETAAAKYPLPAVIFESDRQFDAYWANMTQGQGLSAQSISAFYDLLTNRLVVRLRECNTFETALHEAVHQQAYNRGIFQRLAPVPSWFNEGMATGFEGDGERVRSGPKVISDRYGRMALKAKVVSWREIVSNDRTFQGDVLAAEAYGHAWGLHWLLVTKYRAEYNQLVRLYATKQPLDLDRPDARAAEFEKIVGKPIEALQKEFYNELPRAMARRKP